MDQFLDYAPVADGARPGAALAAGVGSRQARLRRQCEAPGFRAASGQVDRPASSRWWTCCAGGKLAKDREEGILALIASLGGPAELALVFDRAVAKEGNTPGRQANLLAALEQACATAQAEADRRSGPDCRLLECGA